MPCGSIRLSSSGWAVDRCVAIGAQVRALSTGRRWGTASARSLCTEWNLLARGSDMRDVAHVEVALRNAYDRVMNKHWRGQAHWLLEDASPVLAPLWRTRRGRRIDLNGRNRTTVSDAIRRCGGVSSAKPGRGHRELSFGFWRHCTDAAHEKALWVPYLHRAWPKKTSWRSA